LRRRQGHLTHRFRLAFALVGALAAFAVTGASAADFEGDGGPCTETPGEGALLRCPTGYVGEEYEVEIESEEGSGCTSPGNPYVWYEIVNSSLPAGLTMSRAGVISGTPTSAGFTRFWIWNHDLTQAQGGPDWCQREDKSEREFSIYIDPGLEIENESLQGPTIGQSYSETLTAQQVVTLNPPTGTDVQATWSIESGSLPPGLALSPQGLLTGTPTTEGSWGVVIRAQKDGTIDSKQFSLAVRQPVAVKSPFAAGVRPSAEVGIRLAKTATATGGAGPYTWSLTSGALPTGTKLDAKSGAISGTPTSAGAFAFALAAEDVEGRVATANLAVRVAPRLALRRTSPAPAQVGSPYRLRVATTGGVAPVTWKLTGKLPSGLQFSKTTGAITGTPKRAGTSTVVVEARDALGAKAQQRLAIRVTA